MKRTVRITMPPPSPFDDGAVISPFMIGRLARRKGLTVDSIRRGKGGRRFARLADAKTGTAIGSPTG
jgi:hypothetical protein